ncbi:Translation elongation factor P [Candidatus Omnitrophus magneticus]|uniref:Elongation factor P n=1 Tax=Candidatus Omnitrophus magneticus TaxID=1609969 RepID=A0A0F0CQC5_9BACT|nr:Translation elongation factor P [Candidatus Omnitrophus magneticus]
MIITARDFRSGVVVNYEGSFHEVIDSHHHKPGKGGAFVKSKLRNLNTGSIVIVTLRPEDTYEEVYIELKPVQYLYHDDLGYCFMDEENFEQIHVPESKMGTVLDYLKENMVVIASMYEGSVLAVNPPIHVVLEITYTEPGFKGNTVSGATKTATLETGKVIRVPLFVENGQKVKIDTRTGDYVERVT